MTDRVARLNPTIAPTVGPSTRQLHGSARTAATSGPPRREEDSGGGGRRAGAQATSLAPAPEAKPPSAPSRAPPDPSRTAVRNARRNRRHSPGKGGVVMLFRVSVVKEPESEHTYQGCKGVHFSFSQGSERKQPQCLQGREQHLPSPSPGPSWLPWAARRARPSAGLGFRAQPLPPWPGSHCTLNTPDFRLPFESAVG